MYHRQVSSSPRFVDAIIDSREAGDSADMIRLSTAGVAGSPASAAECLLECSAFSVPAEIHDVSPAGSPLSNTDWSRPEECATTNGAHSSPGYPGSENRSTGSAASRSPTRVPPPGLEKTVRPSPASLAPADQYR